jgi:hypothetical protein
MATLNLMQNYATWPAGIGSHAASVPGLAHALMTYNVSDFASAGERFKIAVVHPAELLRKVKP